MLTRPLHQGHTDNAVGGRAGERTALPGVGLSTAKGEGRATSWATDVHWATSSQMAPTVKGRGVFKAGPAAVIPAVTIWKGTEARPEQLCWGHSNMPWSQQCREHLRPLASAHQVCDLPGAREVRPRVSSLSPATLSADRGSCCRQLKYCLCTEGQHRLESSTLLKHGAKSLKYWLGAA